MKLKLAKMAPKSDETKLRRQSLIHQRFQDVDSFF